MSEHPILFSTEMVRAILDRLKTQTRRVVVPQPPVGATSAGNYCAPGRTYHGQWEWLSGDPRDCDSWGVLGDSFRCPYGVPGDRLWARETWQHGPEDCVYYLADNDPNENGWRPSIHMPRWASRILLEVTDVRVQRVQEISEADAQAEGIQKPLGSQFWQVDPRANVLPEDNPKLAFENFWDSINAKRGYPWQSNPWVWAITFKVAELQKGRAK